MNKINKQTCWKKHGPREKKNDPILYHPNKHTDSELFWENLPQYSILTLIGVQHYCWMVRLLLISVGRVFVFVRSQLIEEKGVACEVESFTVQRPPPEQSEDDSSLYFVLLLLVVIVIISYYRAKGGHSRRSFSFGPSPSGTTYGRGVYSALGSRYTPPSLPWQWSRRQKRMAQQRGSQL
jgi:hypothetical protein